MKQNNLTIEMNNLRVLHMIQWPLHLCPCDLIQSICQPINDMYECMCVYVCVYVCVRMYVCVCMCVYMYVSMYVATAAVYRTYVQMFGNNAYEYAV